MKKNIKIGILLVPAYGRAEFNNLPVPYFWLNSIVIKKKIVEVIAFNTKDCNQITGILSHEIDSLLMTGKSCIVEAKINTFNFCLDAITKAETSPAPWVYSQILKKDGIYTTPDELILVPT